MLKAAGALTEHQGMKYKHVLEFLVPPVSLEIYHKREEIQKL